MKHRHLNGLLLCSNKVLIWTLSIFCGIFAADVSAKESNLAKVAFLGDSISVGAVTNPNLSFNRPYLWEMFRGQKSFAIDPAYFTKITGKEIDLNPPLRLWPTMREFEGPLDWVGINMMHAISSVFLDTEEYSWGFQLAKRLGRNSEEILIAAQDGARVMHAPRQLDRVLNQLEGKLPNQTFVFFTGNDLCGPSMDYVTTPGEFEKALRNFFDYLMRNAAPSPNGSDIYLLGFMSILQLTGNDDILNKKVSAHGQIYTCKELGKDRFRNQSISEGQQEFLQKNPEAYAFFQFFPTGPSSMCPTVFGQNLDHTDNQRSILANRIRKFRETSIKVVRAVGEKIRRSELHGKLRVHYLDEPEDLLFTGEDIANDCFHLSLAGQSKLANLIFEGLKKI